MIETTEQLLALGLAIVFGIFAVGGLIGIAIYILLLINIKRHIKRQERGDKWRK